MKITASMKKALTSQGLTAPFKISSITRLSSFEPLFFLSEEDADDTIFNALTGYCNLSLDEDGTPIYEPEKDLVVDATDNQDLSLGLQGSAGSIRTSRNGDESQVNVNFFIKDRLWQGARFLVFYDVFITDII